MILHQSILASVRRVKWPIKHPDKAFRVFNDEMLKQVLNFEKSVVSEKVDDIKKLECSYGHLSKLPFCLSSYKLFRLLQGYEESLESLHEDKIQPFAKFILYSFITPDSSKP